MTTPRCGLLFHFTHLDNLPQILAAEALLSDATVCARGLLSTEGGDPEIKERRRRQAVACSPGGFVADYVPFYFAARSPMMYKLWVGGVPSFTGDHRDLVYFVSDVDRMVAAGVTFAISDRNAAIALAEFTNDVSLLGDLTTRDPQSSFVDWPLMKERAWNNTPDDGERMERRMAEFLVRGEVPFSLLAGTAVRSEDRRARVEQLFSEAGCNLQVVVRDGWYYS
ncbi:MAG: type II toxin-antitoxin system toxin DNA ADP-ribosyl transferase DarT [Acidimicrobiales bacterium]